MAKESGATVVRSGATLARSSQDVPAEVLAAIFRAPRPVGGKPVERRRSRCQPVHLPCSAWMKSYLEIRRISPGSSGMRARTSSLARPESRRSRLWRSTCERTPPSWSHPGCSTNRTISDVTGRLRPCLLIASAMLRLKLTVKVHWQILIAIVLAVSSGPSPERTQRSPDCRCSGILDFLGTVFISALKMLIVPLVCSSIIVGAAAVGSGGDLGRLGLRTVMFFLITTISAIVDGIDPGQLGSTGHRRGPSRWRPAGATGLKCRSRRGDCRQGFRRYARRVSEYCPDKRHQRSGWR